jgi:glycosyltransferase involved in cell wall biosynthesis
MLRVSVVIPTFRRKDALLRALRSLASQSIAPTEYEVVVVVDGSDDGTLEAAESSAQPYSLRVLWQGNRGRAAARNTGVAAAQGELLVMLDDDMEASPQLLEAHLRAHQAGPRLAVIGAAPIALDDAAPPPTAYIARKFNRHLEHLARAGGPVALRDFYSGNFSIRRDVFDSVHGFDERFTIYGNEDLELSLRLVAAGVAIVYDPAALAHQSYDKSFDALARDNVAKGRTAVLFARLHPEARAQLKLGTFGREPLRRRIVVNALLAATRLLPPLRSVLIGLMAWLGEHRIPGAQFLYPLALDYLYLCGARDAERELPAADATAA